MKARYKKIIDNNWPVFLAAVIAGIIAIIGAAYVLIWFVEASDIGLQGTATFDQWSMAWVVEFVIKLIFWELLLVGLPALIIFGGGGSLWWQNLSKKEKQEFKRLEKEDKRNHARDAGGCGFFMNIAYIIYIYLEGNFNTPFGSLPYSYWLKAYLMTIMWLFIIVGIPISILGMMYYKFGDTKPKMKKKTVKKKKRK